MTDKLHCPFCGMELKTDVNLLGYSTKYWYCENTSCAHLKDSMHEDVWQALIDGKKAQGELERTRKALDVATGFIKGISQTVINDCDNQYVVLGNFKKLAQGTIEQITALEQKDNK